MQLRRLLARVTIDAVDLRDKPAAVAKLDLDGGAELGDDSYRTPTGKPLTLAAYAADDVPRACVQPLAVGDALQAMPLFLTPGTYIIVPLEETYQAAYRSVPQRWRSELNAKPRGSS